MDPFSVIVLALIYAALKAPGEAGRAVRGDYRGRRDRWSSRAEPWMNPRGRNGRGHGGRRVAGYDRNGRAYSDRQRDGRRRGDPGWWRDPQAWRGREGRARVARGVRPSAIRAGIISGALAYTAVFGAAVAARGFARGLRGGYQMGRKHYLGKRNQAQDPTFTVAPGDPGDPDAEVVDAVIVEDPAEQTPPTNTAYTTPDDADGDDGPITVVHEPVPDDGRDAWLPPGWEITVVDTRKHVGPGADDFEVVDRITVTDPAELRRRMADIAASPYLWGFPRDLRDIPKPRARDFAGFEITVFAPGSNIPIDRFVTTDPDEANTRYSRATAIPGLRVEFRELEQLPEDSRPGTSPAGPTTTPGGTSMTENTRWTPAEARDTLHGKVSGDVPERAPGSTLTRQVVPVGSPSISAPMLMEGANYDAHLHNLNVIAKEARAEYSSAELTLASASAARQRAEHAMNAVEQMAVGLAAQDFGATHVGNMASLHDLLAQHVGHARSAERAAQESLATSEQLIEMCTSAAAVFRRDHEQLAEAHASAPHAAKTREAYQPM